MATVEFITKRIEGKEKEIKKLESKLVRIQKAQATDWEVNPYYYHESDLKYTTRDLETARKALEKLNADLELAQTKAASRNIPAIIEFLDNWKVRMTDYHHEQFPVYLEERTELYRIDREYTDWYNAEGFRTRRNDPDTYYAKHDAHKNKQKAFNEKWGWLMPYIDGNQFLEDKLQKDLTNEANRKYDFIVERTCEIVGQITDASNLKVGFKGDLNGYIIGTEGTAKVQTIGAGGWNIQCFHFRTLINRM